MSVKRCKVADTEVDYSFTFGVRVKRINGYYK